MCRQWIEQFALRLCYVWRGRGYGVHSPSIYRFIRNVVSERLPYYAYVDLAEKAVCEDKTTERLCRLYLRIANDMQPGTFVDIRPTLEAYADYVKAGCASTVVQTTDADNATHIISASSVPVLVRLTLGTTHYANVMSIAETLPETSVMIAEGIRRNDDARRQWRTIRQCGNTGVTLDLYHCGIVFFDKCRTKHNYIIGM